MHHLIHAYDYEHTPIVEHCRHYIMICDICKGALEHRHNVLTGHDTWDEKLFSRYPFGSTCGHHRTWESLQASVDAGCWICAKFDAGTKKLEREPLPTTKSGIQASNIASSDFISIFVIQSLPTKSYLIRIFERRKLSVVTLTTTQTLSELCSILCNNHMTNMYIALQDEMTQVDQGTKPTSCIDSLHMVERWLSDCDHAHTECRSIKREDLWFPTRLIDLGRPDAETDQIRLTITKEVLPVGSYVTLSHCWGQGKVVRLLKANLEEFRRAIPLEDMPKTFSEAMIVCRKLRIRYLWIDSLCIMQDKDDLSDWSREAGLMHQVYSNAYFNISASDATDATHGLFRNRRDPAPKRLTIGEKDEDGAWIRQKFFVEEDYNTWHSLWQRNVSRSPINKRGWVFQERLLAPRVVHFSNTQLFWECREKAACERYPDLDLSVVFKSQAAFKKLLDYTKYMAKASTQLLDQEELATCYAIWDSLVEHYTNTLLTEPKDKLVAISGIANHFASTLKDTYIVGMWRQRLESQLLWRRSAAGDKIGSRSKIYRAPTWSWASMEKQIKVIQTHYGPSDVRASVDDIQVTYKTHDVTGEVERGYLDLRGHLRPLQLSGNDVSFWDMDMNVSGIKDDFVMAARLDEWDIHDPEHLLRESAAQHLFYMPIIATDSCISSIMMQLVHGQTGTFTRIGLLELFVERTSPAFWTAFLDDLQGETRELLPCLRYEGGKHVVRVL
jgi:hypothetical protein